MTKSERAPEVFPHFCPECGETAVFPETITHETAFKHENRLYHCTVPNLTVNKCRECGGIIFPDAALDKITDAFRAHAGLLTTSEIAENLKRLGLSQKQFAERIGIAEETISRWMSSVQVQSQALDNLMRIFFRLPEIRTVLSEAAVKDQPLPRTEAKTSPAHRRASGKGPVDQ